MHSETNTTVDGICNQKNARSDRGAEERHGVDMSNMLVGSSCDSRMLLLRNSSAVIAGDFIFALGG